MQLSKCRSCGARIIWATTDKGKRIPLDENPTENGNMLLGVDGKARVVTDTAMFAGEKRLSHFATCPNAGKHRKARTTA